MFRPACLTLLLVALVATGTATPASAQPSPPPLDGSGTGQGSNTGPAGNPFAPGPISSDVVLLPSGGVLVSGENGPAGVVGGIFCGSNGLQEIRGDCDENDDPGDDGIPGTPDDPGGCIPQAPTPPGPPPALASLALPVPDIATAPDRQALVQIWVGAWDVQPDRDFEVVVVGTGGNDAACGFIPPPYAVYFAEPVEWRWGFDSLGSTVSDPFASPAADGEIGRKVHDEPGGPAFGDCSGPTLTDCWSGTHRYRDDALYYIDVGVVWQWTAVGGTAAVALPADSAEVSSIPYTTPMDVFEVRSGQTGAQ